MRVMLLTSEYAKPAEAGVIENPVTKKLYYNIWHGMRANGFWSYVCTLNHKHFAPRTKQDRLQLNRNNYMLKPVMKKGDPVKDTRGNELYCICVNEECNDHKCILLFWEIPNINYINVKYTITNNAALLGEGSYGKIRGNNYYISPYPVLEIMGDCTLTWEGEDKQGSVYKQVIEVIVNNESPFILGEIVKTERE